METGISFFRPKATTDQKLMVLRVLMDSLPKANPDNATVTVEAYLVALDGVSEAALWQARDWALQGRHGSLFAPWPTELRKLCNDAEQPYLDELAKLKRLERLAAEKLPPDPVRTPEEIERHAERMRRFYASHDTAVAELAAKGKSAFAKPPLMVEYDAETARILAARRERLHPPDWLDGEKLTVTPALLKVLEAKQKQDADA